MVTLDAETARKWPERVSISKSLSHPHLLRELDHGETRIDGESYNYLVNERVEERLDDVLTERALTAEETRTVLEATLTALNHLHQRGYQHGNVRPASIVAARDQVKLLTGSARLMPAGDVDARRSMAGDLRELAETTTELLTRKRSVTVGASLPSPFGELVRASLGTHECPSPTAAQLLRVLEGKPLLPPEPVKPAEPKPGVAAVQLQEPAPVLQAHARRRRDGIFLAVAVLLVLALALAAFRSDRGARDTVVQQSEPPLQKPSPVISPAPVPAKELPRVQPKAEPARGATTSNDRGQWGVVAAIYRDYDAAARRAEKLSAQWKGAKPVIHPPRGKGKRYLVVLGSGMTQEQAERLRAAAQTAGMPRDSYVTRLQF